jgi:hypothetical protein
MDKIIFHIGLHKTGSTALQQFFWENKEELAKIGIIYPKIGVDYFAHQNLAYDLNQDSRFNASLGTFVELTSFCNKIKQGTVVISSENFEFCNTNTVQKISQAFHTDQIEVVVYLRRQDQFLQSEYTQQVKHGYCRLEFEDFLDQNIHAERVHYLRYLNKWIEVLGQKSVKVRIFEKPRLVNQNIIHDFLSLLPNYDLTKTFADSYRAYSANNKPAYEIVEVIRLLAKNFVDDKSMDKSIFSKTIAEPILKSENLKSKYQDPFNKLTPEIQQMIINHFMSDNQHLVDVLSRDLSEKGWKNAFSTEIYSGKVTNRDISLEEYTNIIDKVGLSETVPTLIS